MKMRDRTKNRLLLAGAFLCLSLLSAFALWKLWNPILSRQESQIYSLTTSLFGCLLFLFMLLYASYQRILTLSLRRLPRQLLFLLPCFLVAVNNFPILPFLTGRAYITGTGGEVLLYFFVCLGTGLFEEFLFRGYLFMMLLEKRRDSVRGIFEAVLFSSAIFGAFHLVNLFMGADAGATLLQVGYSFLIGGMCAVALLYTGSLWYPVVLHALYNFAGGVVPTLGGGILWDTPTVALTVILTLLAALSLTVSLLRIDLDGVRHLFSPRASEKEA